MGSKNNLAYFVIFFLLFAPLFSMENEDKEGEGSSVVLSDQKNEWALLCEPKPWNGWQQFKLGASQVLRSKGLISLSAAVGGFGGAVLLLYPLSEKNFSFSRWSLGVLLGGGGITAFVDLLYRATHTAAVRKRILNRKSANVDLESENFYSLDKNYPLKALINFSKGLISTNPNSLHTQRIAITYPVFDEEKKGEDDVAFHMQDQFFAELAEDWKSYTFLVKQDSPELFYKIVEWLVANPSQKTQLCVISGLTSILSEQTELESWLTHLQSAQDLLNKYAEGNHVRIVVLGNQKAMEGSSFFQEFNKNYAYSIYLRPSHDFEKNLLVYELKKGLKLSLNSACEKEFDFKTRKWSNFFSELADLIVKSYDLKTLSSDVLRLLGRDIAGYTKILNPTLSEEEVIANLSQTVLEQGNTLLKDVLGKTNSGNWLSYYS